MNCDIRPDIATAAIALHRSHPHVPALEVLDLVMRQRVGRLDDFGDSTRAGSAFGDLIAAAFDRGMSVDEWRVVTNPKADPALVAALLSVWRDEVLPAFAARYGLAT